MTTWIFGTGCILALAMGPAALGWLNHNAAVATRMISVEAPVVTAPWHGPLEIDPTAWRPRHKGAAQTLLRRYVHDDITVYLYVAYYRHQRQGAELINSENALYDGTRWRRLGETRHAVLRQDGGHMAVAEILLDSDAGQRLVWYWYAVSGRTTLSPLVTKLYELWYQLRGNYEGSTIVALAIDTGMQTDSARRALEDFVQQALRAGAAGLLTGMLPD